MLDAAMSTSGSAKRTRDVTSFPDDLMHSIFSKIDLTKDKLNAGLACKDWDRLLQAGTAAARHWDIKYSVKRTVAGTDFEKNGKSFMPDHPITSAGRSAQRSTPYLVE